MAAVLLAG
uniref:Uncharacterized protein n=1 Tax=Rhizophora mucronata TaxID=61149 RepID=A0A2P2NUD8_RHIMU